MVGYRDPIYFGKIFKKHTSFLPTEYRQKILDSRDPDSGLVTTRNCP
jgi:AraC-like DNA-binding protein